MAVIAREFWMEECIIACVRTSSDFQKAVDVKLQVRRTKEDPAANIVSHSIQFLCKDICRRLRLHTWRVND